MSTVAAPRRAAGGPACARASTSTSTTMRTAITSQFQYRAANYIYMLGMVAEPVIYLVVWTTIAEDSGGIRRRAARRASSPPTTSSGRSSAT